MERRMIQSDVIHWVANLSPAEQEELLITDRPRSLTCSTSDQKQS